METKGTIVGEPTEKVTTETEQKVNADGTITTTETTTTVKKQNKIDYDQPMDMKTFVHHSDKLEEKYPNALEYKQELAIFIEKLGHVPVAFISLDSFKKILKFNNQSIQTSYDLVLYSIYSMEEIREIRQAVRTSLLGKANDFKFDYRKEYEVLMPNASKLPRPTQCVDLYDKVDELLAKLRKKDEEPEKLQTVDDIIRGDVEPIEKEEEKPVEKEEEKPVEKEEENPVEKEEEKPVEKEEEKQPEENHFDEEVKETKPAEEERPKTPPKEEEDLKKADDIETKVEDHPTVVETPARQDTINELSNPVTSRNNEQERKGLTTQTETKVEETQDDTKKKEEPKEEVKQVKKKVLVKKKAPPKVEKEPSEKDTEEYVPREPPKKKKVIKKVVKRVQKPVFEDNHRPLLYTGGAAFHNANACNIKSCVICRGLPVRPQECQKCHKQYCSLCTYELQHPGHCAECDGLLIGNSERPGASQVFESNITKISPIIREESENKYVSMTAKDFYERNRDRYVDGGWKGENENEDEKEDEEDEINKNVKVTKRRFFGNTKGIKEEEDKEPNEEDEDKENLDSSKKAIHKRNFKTLGNKSDLGSYVSKKQKYDVDWKKYYHLKKYWEDLTVKKKLTLEQGDSIWSICYIPLYNKQKDALLTGHSSGNIFLWDIEKNIKQKTFSAHRGKVYDIKQIPLDSYRTFFISVSDDRAINFWDSSFQSPIYSISVLSPCYTIDIINKSCFVFGDKNRNIHIYNVLINPKSDQYEKSLSIVQETDHETSIWRVRHLSKIKNAKYIISSGTGTLMMHKLDKNQLTFICRYFDAHEGLIHDIVELEEGYFATCGIDSVIKFWQYDKLNCIRVIPNLYDDTIFSMMYLNDHDPSAMQNQENVVVFGGYDKKMKFIETNEKLCNADYVRDESLYMMKYMSNNPVFKIATINFGTTSNVFLWGAKQEINEE